MTGLRRAVLCGLTSVVITACDPSADDELLARSWQGYRARFITADGRVVRPEDADDSVSEGQAYAMLRAAWMNDQATFDRVWRWTRSTLGRQGREWPSLLAWRWTPDGGVQDWNVATDADADTALALLLAASRWPRAASNYREAALAMLADLVAHGVAPDPRGVLHFLPGAWADERAARGRLILNPSYLAPASFRVFHRATGDERWLALVDSAYEVLEATCAPPVGGLAPDRLAWYGDHWEDQSLEDGYGGWDAVRVPWRVATDWLWFREPRARDYLNRCVQPVVRRRLAAGGGMAVEFGPDGGVRGFDDHPLANALFSFALESPAERDQLLARVSQEPVGRDHTVFFGEANRYYVNSLAYLPYLARAGRYTPP